MLCSIINHHQVWLQNSASILLTIFVKPTSDDDRDGSFLGFPQTMVYWKKTCHPVPLTQSCYFWIHQYQIICASMDWIDSNGFKSNKIRNPMPISLRLGFEHEATMDPVWIGEGRSWNENTLAESLVWQIHKSDSLFGKMV